MNIYHPLAAVLMTDPHGSATHLPLAFQTTAPVVVLVVVAINFNRSNII
jgi:hypothetical protein